MDLNQLLNDDSLIIMIFLIILSAIVIFILWFNRKRIYYASIMGKIEHLSGRLLGLALIATFFIEYFKPCIYTVYSIVGCFAIWVVYLFAHSCEKLFYGHSGPRG